MDLYQFQKEDIEKLIRQKSALIGSEMGTGKTHEAIALDEAWYDGKPTLVVAPLNTFDSWQEKYAAQSPRTKLYTIDRKNRDQVYVELSRERTSCPVHNSKHPKHKDVVLESGIHVRITGSASMSTNVSSQNTMEYVISADDLLQDVDTSTMITEQCESGVLFVFNATLPWNVLTPSLAGSLESKCTCPPDVVLIHWDALRLMPELARIEFSTVIADEAHRASNRKAQATRSLKKLHATHRLALSGTATGDKPENLWSVAHWLWPTYYTAYWKFREKYCLEKMTYGPNGSGYSQIIGVNPATIGYLHEEMDPWFVRHLKREQCCEHHPEGVMPWLPEKTYDRIWVDLTPLQKRIYEQMRKEMVAWVNEHEDSPLVASVVVAQMVRLSQIALATPTIDSDGRVRLSLPSSKIDAVKELIKDHDNKQFVVFSASKQACYLAAQEFERVGILSEVLSGDTPQSDRDGMVRRFNDGRYQVFIGVIQAAAEGIDGLQHSTDTAIFLDRSWSTIKNKQAEDRIHRDGTGNACNIIDVMARGTLDFGRHQRLETKWEWIKKMLGDPATAQATILGGRDLDT